MGKDDFLLKSSGYSSYSRRQRRKFLRVLPYIVLVSILAILLCIAAYLYMRNKSLETRGVLGEVYTASDPSMQGPDPDNQGAAGTAGESSESQDASEASANANSLES